MKLPESLHKIMEDNLSGSVDLLKRFIIALENELMNPELEASTFIAYVEFFRKKMEMFTVVRHFCDELILTHNISDRKYPVNYLEFMREYRDFWERAPQLLLKNLNKVEKLEGKTIMLHSNSGTLREVLRLYAEDTTRVKIFQTLAAPAEEGRIQAHDLANMGYEVTLIADTLAAEKMKMTDYLILAADQVRQNTIVNKTGSLQMVLAAQEFHVPVLVLTESRKLSLYGDSGAFRDRKRDPDEILREIRHPHLTAENLYFEEIPKYYISRMITEKRVLEVNE